MSPFKNVEKKREWQNKRRCLYKKKIESYKKKVGKCKRCGWSENPEILQFHHRNKEDKKFGFSAGCLGNYSWDKVVLKEIKKCDLLCPNCHLLLHYKETRKKIIYN